MAVYEVVGALSVPFVVYVEADSEEAAEQAVLGQSGDFLLGKRTGGVTVEEAMVAGTATRKADIDAG